MSHFLLIKWQIIWINRLKVNSCSCKFKIKNHLLRTIFSPFWYCLLSTFTCPLIEFLCFDRSHAYTHVSTVKCKRIGKILKGVLLFATTNRNPIRKKKKTKRSDTSVYDCACTVLHTFIVAILEANKTERKRKNSFAHEEKGFWFFGAEYRTNRQTNKNAHATSKGKHIEWKKKKKRIKIQTTQYMCKFIDNLEPKRIQSMVTIT